MTPTGAQPRAAAADASDEHPPRKVTNPMTTPTMSGHTAPTTHAAMSMCSASHPSSRAIFDAIRSE